MVAQNSKVLDLLTRVNVAGAHILVTGVVGPGLQDLFTRKPKRDSAKQLMEDPFSLFCQRNERRPQLLDLRIAHYGGRRELEERLMRRIQKGSWISFLDTAYPANATRLHRGPRKRDGREAMERVSSREAPLKHEGVLYTNALAKCELLADHFARRFNDRTAMGGEVCGGPGAAGALGAGTGGRGLQGTGGAPDCGAWAR